MSSQAVTNSKSDKCSSYYHGRLDKSIREPNYVNFITCAILTILKTMKTSSKPIFLTMRDLTYIRAKTDIVARTSMIMMILANIGPLLWSPPVGGLSREAIVEFCWKVEECTRRQLSQAGRFSDIMEVGSGNETEQEACDI